MDIYSSDSSFNFAAKIVFVIVVFHWYVSREHSAAINLWNIGQVNVLPIEIDQIMVSIFYTVLTSVFINITQWDQHFQNVNSRVRQQSL